MPIEITPELVKLTDGIMVNLCRAHNVPEWEVDDFLGEARLGLVRFTRTYNPDKRASFQTYLRHRLRGFVKDCIRKNIGRTEFSKKRQLRFVSIEDLSFKTLNSLSANGTEDRTATKDLAYKILSRLPQRLAVVLRLHYMSDMSQREISEVLSLTASRINQLVKEGIKEGQRIACWL